MPSRPLQSNTVNAYPGTDLGHCHTCGARILCACPRCGLRLRGLTRALVPPPGRAIARSEYARPSFCDGCGAPHPWADRQTLIYELQNLLDEEDIDDADRLIVTEHLQRLQEAGPDDDPKVEATRWKAIKQRAPGLFQEPGRQIMNSLIDVARAWTADSRS